LTHRSWFSAPRYLLVLFLATGTLLVCALLWLGWQLARQDRDLEAQRLQERRESAAELAVVALRRSLAQAEERVAALCSALDRTDFDSQAAELAATLPTDSVLISVRRETFAAYPANRLAFYPEVAMAPAMSQTLFASADALEFGSGNHVAALAALDRLARGSDRSIRAAALVRRAAIFRRRGQWQAAIDVYGELERLGDVSTEGVPAELLARHARLTILTEQGRTSDARREAPASALMLGPKARPERSMRAGAWDRRSALRGGGQPGMRY